MEIEEILHKIAKNYSATQDKQTVLDIIAIYKNKYENYEAYKKEVAKREWNRYLLNEELFGFITELKEKETQWN